MPKPTPSRPVRDCPHNGHPHRHGTRTAYVNDHCRCADCTTANTHATRTRRRNQAFGRLGDHELVDAGPARAHVGKLRAAGYGYHTIASRAGTSTRHLRDIARTPSTPDRRPTPRRIRVRLANAILAIPTTTPAALLDPTGTRRRITALVALGWPLPELATKLRRRPDSLHRTLTTPRVTASTARAVDNLYRQLSGNPPPDTPATRAAREHARQRGWVPPLAWDDIDTDPTPDPTATKSSADDGIDDIAIERAASGDLSWRTLTRPERTETIRLLANRGNSNRAIAIRLQASSHTIRRHIANGAA